jgi:hypothetical protein
LAALSETRFVYNSKSKVVLPAMKIFIRLSPDIVVEYTCRGARNGLARVATHQERIQQLVLSHFHLSSVIFEVILCSEELQKEEASSDSPDYYVENTNYVAVILPIQITNEELDEESEEELESATASQKKRIARRA